MLLHQQLGPEGEQVTPNPHTLPAAPTQQPKLHTDKQVAVPPCWAVPLWLTQALGLLMPCLDLVCTTGFQELQRLVWFLWLSLSILPVLSLAAYMYFSIVRTFSSNCRSISRDWRKFPPVS